MEFLFHSLTNERVSKGIVLSQSCWVDVLGIEEALGYVAIISTFVCAVFATGNDLSQSHVTHLSHTCNYINKVCVCSS